MGRPGPSQKLTVAKIDRRKTRLRLTLQLRSSQRQASTETSNPEPRKEENNERSFFFFEAWYPGPTSPRRRQPTKEGQSKIQQLIRKISKAFK